MARSLASGAAIPVLGAPAIGRKRPELALELLDAGLERARLPVAIPEHEDGDAADHDGDAEVEEVAHPIGSTGVARVPHPCCSPPAQISRFQMGSVAFSVSMAKRAASNASPRCGADTT